MSSSQIRYSHSKTGSNSGIVSPSSAVLNFEGYEVQPSDGDYKAVSDSLARLKNQTMKQLLKKLTKIIGLPLLALQQNLNT